MLMQFDCCRCVFNQVADLAEKCGRSDDQKRRILEEMVEFFLRNWRKNSPPVLAEKFFTLAAEALEVEDLFKYEKDKSTEIALELMKKLPVETLDFQRKLLLAIGGNAIDFGATPDFDMNLAETRVLEVLEQPFDAAAALDLQERMAKAQKIFYILDNCGEAVLDNLLISLYPEKMTLGVRGKPIINDVTRFDLVRSGLGAYRVVDTGRAAPGVPYPDVNEEFVAAMKNCDLVIAKGQGNYESLSHVFTEKPIYYLLRAKCRVVAAQLGAELNSVQIIGKNLESSK